MARNLEWDMPKTADQVTQCVVNNIFPVDRWTCVPNASFGLGLHWEADLLALSGSGYLYETEVKVSMQDLKRDRDKRKWSGLIPPSLTPEGVMKGFYFAMPASLAARPDAQEIVPYFAGILSCKYLNNGRIQQANVIRRPRINSRAKKYDDEFRAKMMRLATMRYWKLQGKAAFPTEQQTEGA